MDDLDILYNDGFEIGKAGIKSLCPEDVYHADDHARRDAWIAGYKAGWRERRRDMHGYSRGSIDHAEGSKGTLWLESKDDNGFMAIRDCEGGTILCKIQIDHVDEPRVLIPKHNESPEMAMIVAKAVAKAASIAYRIQQDRIIRPRDYRAEMTVPPSTKRQANAQPPDPLALALSESGNIAFRLGKILKKMHWHIRQNQPLDGLSTLIRSDFAELSSAVSDLHLPDDPQ